MYVCIVGHLSATNWDLLVPGVVPPGYINRLAVDFFFLIAFIYPGKYNLAHGQFSLHPS